MEGGTAIAAVIIGFVIIMGAGGGYFIGASSRARTTETVTQTATTTQLSTSTQYATFVQTQTRTVTTASVSTVISSSTVTTTSVTSTTLTKTLGTGITISDYRLFVTDVLRDSVLKLNLTVNFAVALPTDVIMQAIVVLIPLSGSSNDIKFVPNPIITQSSGLTLTLSMFIIIDHQIVTGTYMIEYAVSTSQGSALVFTVLEIT